MKKSSLSGRDLILLIILVVVLIGVCYYMFFYKPLQKELASIEAECSQMDTDIAIASAKVGQKKKMQEELDVIHAMPADEVTEIAPFDNAKVVMNQLNGILSRSTEYKLNFSDPVIDSDGCVRRNVSMNFTCPDYSSAKAIIQDLTKSQWRCLVGSLSVNGDENVRSGEVGVSATITFFESTKIEG